MGHADNWHHVMFTIGLDPDIAQHDHFVVTVGLLEGAAQNVRRVLLIACEELAVGSHDTVWCSAQTFAVGIVACPTKQCTNGFFCFFTRRAFSDAGFAAHMVSSL